MNRSRRIGLLAASLTLAGTLLAPAALAGPPLLCFPNHIGASASLPWGKDGFDMDKKYDRAKLVDDTLGLLKTERSALVRIETLRRAVIYLGEDRRKATDLLARLAWIAMDAEAAGKPSAEAWFNAGYLAATLAQMGVELDSKPGVGAGRVGYAWIQRAIALDPENPGMHFGAALVTCGDDGLTRSHVRKAVAGATPGSDLARSIESNPACGGKKLEKLRAELGIADAQGSPRR